MSPPPARSTADLERCPEAGLVADGLVGVQADHDVVGSTLDEAAGQRHGGRGVAAHRLTQDVPGQQGGHDLADERRVGARR